jgi:hypothetical protein
MPPRMISVQRNVLNLNNFNRERSRWSVEVGRGETDSAIRFASSSLRSSSTIRKAVRTAFGSVRGHRSTAAGS